MGRIREVEKTRSPGFRDMVHAYQGGFMMLMTVVLGSQFAWQYKKLRAL